jgi:hypothetical protein
LTEFCSISEAKPKEDGKVSEEKDVDKVEEKVIHLNSGETLISCGDVI